MPKTSIKTFLVLIHKLNRDMDIIATNGQQLLQQIADIDFTSVTDPVREEELTSVFEETGENFRKLNDMKEVLMGGLQQKVIDTMNAQPMISRTRSATSARSSVRSSMRKTRKAKSV
jgi:hypothetical protein